MLPDNVVTGTTYVGTYAGSYDDGGNTKISLVGDVGVSITKVTRSGMHVTFELNVTGADRAAVLDFDGPVSNLSIVRTDYVRPNRYTLLDEAIDDLKQYWVLRYMDWTLTNHSPDTTWASRKPAERMHGRGKPWESVFDTFTQIYSAEGSKTKALWINIPYMADQGYIDNLAALAAASIPKGAILYVEYGNENWNSIFPAQRWLHDRANDASDPDFSKISSGGVGEWTRVKYLWGLKTARVARAFIDAFGPTSFGAVVRPVLAGHAVDYSGWTGPSVSFLSRKEIEALYGDPSTYIYTLALAPYLTPERTAAVSETTAEGMLSLLDDKRALMVASIKEWKTGQVTAGIAQLSAYEFGFHTSPANTTGSYLAHTDARARSVLLDAYTDAYAAGLDVIAHFTVGPTKHRQKDVNTLWTINQYWGEVSPKQLALLNVMQSIGQ